MNEEVPFSKIIGSFVFHLLSDQNVYKLSCPRYGQKSNSRDGYYYHFNCSSNHNENKISVFVSASLYAEQKPDHSLEIAILNAAQEKIMSSEKDIELDTGNWKEYLPEESISSPDKTVRRRICTYIQSRYDIDFEPPFSVLEIIIGTGMALTACIKNLHYLHKHEIVQFSWPTDIWKDLGSPYNWLGQEFAISNTNIKNLNSYLEGAVDGRIMSEESSENTKYDCFICHASEDKKEVVEPLAMGLKQKGIKVWYDKWSLKLGDSLRRKIDEGLKQSRYGIVVLSEAFFSKEWPQVELDGLLQKEMDGRKVILPIWHKVSKKDVNNYSLSLANRLAAKTDEDMDRLIDKVIDAIQLGMNLEESPNNHSRISSPADVEVTYERLKIEHDYSLKFRLTLKTPPNQGELRIKLKWPIDIPINSISKSIAQSKVKIDGFFHKQLTIDWQGGVYPGETITILSKDSEHHIYYTFNGEVLSTLNGYEAFLHYEVYFEDHEPIKDKIPFKELYVF